MHSIRLAEAVDITPLIALHRAPRHDSDRASFIRRSVAGRSCYVTIDGGLPIGYAVLEYSFYENGFVAVLCRFPLFLRPFPPSDCVEHSRSDVRDVLR